MRERGDKTIAITRPVGKGKDTAELVRRLGWSPLIFHTVELKPFDDRMIRDQMRSSMIGRPVDWIVFMSSSGVKPLLNNLDYFETSGRESLRATRYLAVGLRTKETLLNSGSPQVEVPERYSSEGVSDFFSKLTFRSLRVVLVRSSSADDSLAKSLESMGARVETINVYGSEMPSDLTSVFSFLEQLFADGLSAILFTSATSVSNLFKIAETKFEEREMVRSLNSVRVGAIGPATGEELRRRGVEPILPEEYLIESAVKRLVIPTSNAQV